jgi:radical SAM superfamily enzyme YgiQ (UPF0313 family)
MKTLKDKKVLLATLDSSFMDDSYVFPYLGVLYLMSVAKRAGADVSYTDEFNIDDAAYFDVIGISCLTPQGGQAYQLCRQIKASYPKKMVILGGPHATHYLNECRKEPFDIIVTGDGERVFEELLLGKVDNLASRLWDTPDQLIFHDTLTAEEMNSYPIPYREESYINKYTYNLAGVDYTTLMSSRGCPMRCAFCEQGGTKARWFTPDHFEAEIRSIVDLGIKGVMIFDDLFALSPVKVKPYLEILKKYQIVFRCFGHAKIMTPEFAAMLYDAGCVEIAFGGESADQGILDTVNKRTTVEQMHAFIETVIQTGIRVKAFFIIGLPGETEQTFQKTYDFIEKYRTKYPDLFSFDLTVFFPYKGTYIGDMARAGNDRFNIRPKLDWGEIDAGGYGANKKKLGTSDIVIESYDWEKGRVLLSAERIGELQAKTLKLSGRYNVPSCAKC